MGDVTNIEWCDSTFNSWEGCQKVGPGCDHCYAETRNARFGGGRAPNWGPEAPRRRTSAANWQKPIKWNREAAKFAEKHGRKQRVFCASLADVFDNAVNPQWRADLFDLIDATPNLDWLLLTKRIGNVTQMVEATGRDRLPENVWLGATVVNQDEADRDVPKLLETLATVRFLSMEPLLGPVDLRNLRDGHIDALNGIEREGHIDARMICAVSWVIVGGESGPDARPMHPDWARSLREQCAISGTQFFMKQWGEWAPGECASKLQTKTEDVADWVDGRWFHSDITPRMAQELHRDYEPDVWRMGKRAAGRLLDGVEHNGFPQVQS